ncbi:hypothetical protein BBJ28_00011185 [Nothophytophthora sp. Chile5]|nr:hypothetical protein BBJ28_00011185 [Nothophytophthora sp. Chile5]
MREATRIRAANVQVEDVPDEAAEWRDDAPSTPLRDAGDERHPEPPEGGFEPPFGYLPVRETAPAPPLPAQMMGGLEGGAQPELTRTLLALLHVPETAQTRPLIQALLAHSGTAPTIRPDTASIRPDTANFVPFADGTATRPAAVFSLVTQEGAAAQPPNQEPVGARRGNSLEGIQDVAASIPRFAETQNQATGGDPPPGPPSHSSFGSSHSHRPSIPSSQHSLFPPAGDAADSALQALMGKMTSSMNVKVMDMTDEKVYEDWKLDLHLKTGPFGFREMIYGDETLDGDRAARDSSYLRCWNERKIKAFTMLATSLSTKLRRLFRVEIRGDDPAELFSAIRKNFERGKGNRIYLKNELYGYRMKKGQSVQSYVDALEAIRRRMTDNGATIDDDEMARVILSDCVLVYPDVSKEHTNWEKTHPNEPLDRRTAISTLETAAQSEKEITSRSVQQSGSGGLQRQVNAVNSTNRGNRGGKNKPSRSNWAEDRQRNDICANCGERGHWYYCYPSELTTELQRKKDAYERKHPKKKGKTGGQPVNMVTSVLIAQSDRTVLAADDVEEKANSPNLTATTDPAQRNEPCARVTDRMPIGPVDDDTDHWAGVIPPADWRIPRSMTIAYEVEQKYFPSLEAWNCRRDAYLSTFDFPLRDVDRVLGGAAARLV